MNTKQSVFLHYASISIVTFAVSLAWMTYYYVTDFPKFAIRIILIGSILAITIFIQNMLLTFVSKKKVEQKTQILAALLLMILISFFSRL